MNNTKIIRLRDTFNDNAKIKISMWNFILTEIKFLGVLINKISVR